MIINNLFKIVTITAFFAVFVGASYMYVEERKSDYQWIKSEDSYLKQPDYNHDKKACENIGGTFYFEKDFLGSIDSTCNLP